MLRQMRGIIWGGALVVAGTLSACGASELAADSATPTSTVAVSPSVSASALSADGATLSESSPTASGTSPLSEGSPIVVDWDSGKGTPEKPEVDPSPIGWYEAAFGGPPEEQGRTLYVTFDDGPSSATADVLELLDRFDARATFFVIGKEASANPQMVAAVSQAGHAVGNHTWTHRDLASLPSEEVAGELTSTSAVGAEIGPCMRPPYGSIDAVSGSTAEALGLQPIMWTGQAFDWRPPPVATIVADIKAATKPGAVILLHDGGGDRTNTVAALSQLLPYWDAAGYSLEPIPACL